MFRKLLDEGRAGENCGALLRGTKRDDVERGQVLAKPGSINPTLNFESEVYTYCQKKKVVVILHSSKATVHSSTSVQQT